MKRYDIKYKKLEFPLSIEKTLEIQALILHLFVISRIPLPCFRGSRLL